jgi:hypothetical protein
VAIWSRKRVRYNFENDDHVENGGTKRISAYTAASERKNNSYSAQHRTNKIETKNRENINKRFVDLEDVDENIVPGEKRD